MRITIQRINPYHPLKIKNEKKRVIKEKLKKKKKEKEKGWVHNPPKAKP